MHLRWVSEGTQTAVGDHGSVHPSLRSGENMTDKKLIPKERECEGQLRLLITSYV